MPLNLRYTLASFSLLLIKHSTPQLLQQLTSHKKLEGQVVSKDKTICLHTWAFHRLSVSESSTHSNCSSQNLGSHSQFLHFSPSLSLNPWPNSFGSSSHCISMCLFLSIYSAITWVQVSIISYLNLRNCLPIGLCFTRCPHLFTIHTVARVPF